jgi:nucleoside-diphosphate-sugar epimerase
MDVRRSVREPDFDAEVNVLGTVRLLQNRTEYGVEKVVFASTGGAVYGEQQVLPAPEDHPLYPVFPAGSPSSHASVRHALLPRRVPPALRRAALTSTGRVRTHTEK